MIADAVLHSVSLVLVSVLNGAFTMIPTPPAWVAGAMSHLNDLYPYIDAMGVWLPINLAIAVGALVLQVWVISVGVQLGRMVISYLTFGGGVVSK